MKSLDFKGGLPIALACLSLGGCASIVDGSTQVLSVQTVSKNGGEVDNAHCSLISNKGTWFVNTPGTVSVHRSYDALNINCKKEGEQPGIATVNSSTKGMAFGNILAGGLIGAAVDMSTGAAYDYPPLITIRMGESIDIGKPIKAASGPDDQKNTAASNIPAAPASSAKKG